MTDQDNITLGVARTSIYVAAGRCIATNAYVRNALATQGGSEEVKNYLAYYEEGLDDRSFLTPAMAIYDPYAVFFSTTRQAVDLIGNTFKESLRRSQQQPPPYEESQVDQYMATTPPLFAWTRMLSEKAVSRVALRTKYIDRMIIDALDTTRTQLVIVASGLDTRALRLSLTHDIRTFEIDLPQVIAYKMPILEMAKQYIPPISRSINQAISADLCLADEWTSKLVASGFDPTKPSMWALEGLLMYLNDDEVASLLSAISSLCCVGSRMLIHTVAPAIKQSDSFIKDEFRSYTSTPLTCLERAGFTGDQASVTYTEIDKILNINLGTFGPSSVFATATKII
eukprot:gene12912-15167_t